MTMSEAILIGAVLLLQVSTVGSLQITPDGSIERTEAKEEFTYKLDHPVDSKYKAGILVSGVTGISLYRPAQSPVIKVTFDEFDTLVDEADEKHSTNGGLPRMFVLANETACLDFLHIPKTAGSSMEFAGTEKGKHWGMHDGRLNCDGLFDCHHRVKNSSFDRCCPMRDGNACSIWHTPPMQSNKLKDSYAKCETFCVVREPYSRFKSQHLWKGGRCSAAALKRRIDEKLEQIKKHPYLDDCHYVPQVEYWLKGEGCQHVIKFENLVADFAALVAKFGFQAEVVFENSSPKCKLDEEIDAESLRKLQEYYADDYAAFGYPRS